MPKLKRAALYVRVSTKGHGQDVDTQLLPLRDYATARGYTIVEEYSDIGVSGSKERRPSLDRLMTDARRRKFDVVLVARFDRFARSVQHLLKALTEFDSLHLDFVSLNEAIDTATPMGRMVFTILGAVAELERSLIRERVVAGLDRAKRQGKQFGRPRVVVDRVRVCEAIERGQSIQATAKEFGIARTTVRGIVDLLGKRVSESPSSGATLPD